MGALCLGFFLTRKSIGRALALTMRSQTVILADQQREIINGAANMEDHETRPKGHSSVDVQTALNKTGRGVCQEDGRAERISGKPA
jgi:hypothetical protein